jgi:hypothetical protein
MKYNMSGIARCNKENNNCIKKDTCKRYLETVGEIMNMLSICHEENNYQWYWQAERSIQSTEENTETESNSNN